MQVLTSVQSIQRQSFPAIRLFGWIERQVMKSKVLQDLFMLAKSQHRSGSPQFPAAAASLHTVDDQFIHIAFDGTQAA